MPPPKLEAHVQLAARNLSNIGANDAAVAPGTMAELRDAHRRLLAEVANMEAVASEPLPDPDRLAAARWRISQASLQRRLMSARIRNALMPTVGAEDRTSLNSLQEADFELHRKSRTHVSTWTTERDKFQRDWQGYCKAAHQLLSHTHDYIALEQRIFYPIVERAERRRRST